MYSVEIKRNGRTQTAYFNHEWQAAQFAEMFLDKDPIIKDPNGKAVVLYANCIDSEF